MHGLLQVYLKKMIERNVYISVAVQRSFLLAPNMMQCTSLFMTDERTDKQTDRLDYLPHCYACMRRIITAVGSLLLVFGSPSLRLGAVAVCAQCHSQPDPEVGLPCQH